MAADPIAVKHRSSGRNLAGEDRRRAYLGEDFSTLPASWAGYADGHLRDAGEVLDVAAYRARLDRLLGDVLKLHSGAVLDKATARRDQPLP